MIVYIAKYSESAAKYRLQVDQHARRDSIILPDSAGAGELDLYDPLSSAPSVQCELGDLKTIAIERTSTRPSGRVLILAQTAATTHLNVCRLLHGSACLPKRESSAGPLPFDVVVRPAVAHERR